MITGPCKGCQERHQGCHSDCAAYKAYKAELHRIAGIKEVERQKDVHNFENTIKIRKRTGYYRTGKSKGRFK